MFSVIIPAFNAEKFIARAIKSVLRQTNQNFEIIIINDGSQDQTEAAISQFEDNRIVYLYQENSGVSAARNRGILASKGEYICFLDADDEWKSNHLEVVSSLINQYADCGMYVTGYDVRLNNGEIVHKSQQILKHVDDECFKSDDGYDVLIKMDIF